MDSDFIDDHLKRALIRKQTCFAQLTDDEVNILTTLFFGVEFKAGETIVTEGDLVDDVYLIVSGEAEVRHVTYNGTVSSFTKLAVLGPTAAIGLNETGFYSLTGKRTATVVASTDIVAICLRISAFHGFALAYPHVNEVMHIQAQYYINT